VSSSSRTAVVRCDARVASVRRRRGCRAAMQEASPAWAPGCLGGTAVGAWRDRRTTGRRESPESESSWHLAGPPPTSERPCPTKRRWHLAGPRLAPVPSRVWATGRLGASAAACLGGRVGVGVAGFAAAASARARVWSCGRRAGGWLWAVAWPVCVSDCLCCVVMWNWNANRQTRCGVWPCGFVGAVPQLDRVGRGW
jgi:hypothetical protein